MTWYQKIKHLSSSRIDRKCRMQCTKCENEAILYQEYSGQHLCRKHFVADIEAKARKAIRQNRWLRYGDHIAVLLSCDPRSGALLSFFADLVKNRPDIHLTAIIPNNAGDGLVDPGDARTLAGSLGIPCFEGSCGESGLSCTILRIAEEKGATRLASAACLEDIAYQGLRHIMRGEIEYIVQDRPGDATTLPVITPFLTIPQKEVMLYAGIQGIQGNYDPNPSGDTFQKDIDTLIGQYTIHHPATPFAVINLITSIAPEAISSGNLIRSRLCPHCPIIRDDDDGLLT
jgi:hypothetical protein